MNNLDFKQSVIERSHTLPIVVDFWASWCGPCQFLGPVIEALAQEAKGRWELVKVNTDENQDISNQYKIRSIPAVKMFYRGEVIAEFVGNLPKHQIIKWLDENIPDKRKEKLTEIISKLNQGNHETVMRELELFVQAYPDLKEGQVWLAAEKVFENAEEAIELVEDIKIGHELFELAEDVRNLAHLMEFDQDGNPKLDEKLELAQNALRQRDKETAIQNLIEAVMLDKTYQGDLPRKATVALFHLLGDQHEITRKYRKRFDMALY